MKNKCCLCEKEADGKSVHINWDGNKGDFALQGNTYRLCINCWNKLLAQFKTAYC